MTVIIDEKDFTKNIETIYPFSGGLLECKGKAVENEGLKAKSLLEQLPEHKPITLEDSEKRLHGSTSGTYIIEDKNEGWENEVFTFTISLKKV